jgi:ABC-type lipoprotein release transport system permease subunit
MNTMYAAVSQRKREIGCLLSMGFTPESVWLAFMIESLLLAALGAALGQKITFADGAVEQKNACHGSFSIVYM